jgi:hypothetical protein
VLNALKISWEFLQHLFGLLSANSSVFITAMTGAFFGAVSAYWSERFKEKRKRQTEEFGAIIRTQMALIGQLNTVSNVKKQFLDPLRDDPLRERKMIAFDMTTTPLRVNYESIAFLLNSEDPNLVHEIHAAEQSFCSAMEVLDTRNRAYEKLHEKSQLEKFDPLTGQCTIAVTDPRAIKLVKDYTDALFVGVDRACERLSTQVAELYKAGKRLYPKKKFLKIAGEK